MKPIIILLCCLVSPLARSQQEPAPAQPRTAPSLNPSMSVIGDFRAMYVSPSRRHFDAEFHEAEVALQSVVDPYARADFFLSFASDPLTGHFGVDVEEAYLTTLELPASLQLKAGKFRGNFGKINLLHPHALPFISVPTVLEKYLGEEGLNDEGASLSWLVPNPLDFYQELTLEATRGPSESPSFVRSPVDRFLYNLHLKNFWDLTDNATLELGLSGATGPNDAGLTTLLGGVDITYKWKPLQFSTYHSLVLQAEVLTSSRKVADDQRMNTWGMYGLASHQLAQRWFLTGRFDYSNIPDNASVVERSFSGVLGWYATEFQKVELEVKAISSNVHEDVHQIVLRSVFVIGAHGAHVY